MADIYFITGATGNVGAPLTEYLLSRGERVVAATRSEDKKSDNPLLEYRRFDFTGAETWPAALDGVTRVFLMRPPHISNIPRDMEPFMEHLKKTGIGQVVFLSVQGADENSLVPHHKVEQALFRLGLPYTVLRPSFFMQNLTTTHLDEIRREKRVYVPSGRGRTNFIDARDIGEIGARVMLDGDHIGKAYTITGDVSYTHGEVAERLSAILDEDIRFVSPGPFRFIVHHLKRGLPLGKILVMLALYSVVRLNRGDVTTGDSEILLGRKTGSLDRFILDHASLLRGE